jgi:hypothetical protein
VVFNPYFGASLPLVPDRTLRHVFDMQPFIFRQLTTAAQATMEWNDPTVAFLE